MALEGQHDTLYEGLFEEECVEEIESENMDSISSLHISFVEDPAKIAEVPTVTKAKSSSENISSRITSFQTFNFLMGTCPPASLPSDISSIKSYIQSSGEFSEACLYPVLESLSSESKRGDKICKPVKSVKQEEVLQIKTKNRENPKSKKCIKIPFLHEILNNIVNLTVTVKIDFVEKLKISIDNNKVLSDNTLHITSSLYLPSDVFAGDFTLNIENRSNGIIVECNSCLNENDLFKGMELISKMSNAYKLIEEKRTEFQCYENERKETSLYVFMQCSNYIAYRKEIINGIEQNFRGCISIGCLNDLALDGNIFCIMRHLISIKYCGWFQCYSVSLLGKTCKDVFCVEDKKIIQINEHVMEVILIKKSKYDVATKKKREISETYFLPSGCIVYHRWKHSPFIVHMDPNLLIQQKKFNPCMELTWKPDTILHSMFEFEKKISHCLLQNFLDNYPEMFEILNDYIICLLHKKPKSVVQLTCEFFTLD